MLAFDNEGDLWIDVGGGEAKAGDGGRQRPGLYRFRVCSQTLRRKSQGWDDVLSESYRKRKAEPDDGSKQEEWVVVLPDHQPGAVAVLLAVIHNRLDMMPPSQNRIHSHCEAISAILSVSDDYDVVHLFSPFVSAWVQCGRLPHYTRGMTYDYTTIVHRLNIAWQMGAVDLLKDAINHFLFRMTKVELDKLWDAANNTPTIAIFPTLLMFVEDLAAVRQKLIQSALRFYEQVTDGLRKNSTTGCKKAMFGAVDRAAV